MKIYVVTRYYGSDSYDTAAEEKYGPPEAAFASEDEAREYAGPGGYVTATELVLAADGTQTGDERARLQRRADELLTMNRRLRDVLEVYLSADNRARRMIDGIL